MSNEVFEGYKHEYPFGGSMNNTPENKLPDITRVPQDTPKQGIHDSSDTFYDSEHEVPLAVQSERVYQVFTQLRGDESESEVDALISSLLLDNAHVVTEDGLLYFFIQYKSGGDEYNYAQNKFISKVADAILSEKMTFDKDYKELLDRNHPNSGLDVPPEHLSMRQPVLSIYKKTDPEQYRRVLHQILKEYRDGGVDRISELVRTAEISTSALNQFVYELKVDDSVFEQKEIVQSNDMLALISLLDSAAGSVESMTTAEDLAFDELGKDEEFVRQIWRVFQQNPKELAQRVENGSITPDMLVEAYTDIEIGGDEYDISEPQLEEFRQFIEQYQ